MIKWLRRLILLAVALVLLFFFVVMPVGISYLITNSRFRFPERNAKSPEELGLRITDVAFASSDGIALSGWWQDGDPEMPTVIFVHGLNRSRQELLERAALAHERGFSILLFDLRNHGNSGNGMTTLGVHETRDVCAASEFVRQRRPGPQVLWGVSLGASTALLATGRCSGFAAVVSDSAFLSLRQTIAHHFTLLFRLPSFPVANLIVALTGWRAGIDPDEGNVEDAVRKAGPLPVLFVAGGADRRMPPDVAERLAAASTSPLSKVYVVPGAGHGEAFQHDRSGYISAVFGFLTRVVPTHSTGSVGP